MTELGQKEKQVSRKIYLIRRTLNLLVRVQFSSWKKGECRTFERRQFSQY